jgi:hypothetical protein
MGNFLVNKGIAYLPESLILNHYSMLAQYLWISGSLIFLLLGIAHLRLTFTGTKLFPKDDSTMEAMKQSRLRITKETTLWKAWTGFNASHSAGAIFFGAVNIILGSQYFWVLRESILIPLLTSGFVLFFLFLAKAYWFKIPLIGVLVATLCFALAIVLMQVSAKLSAG